MNPLLAELDEIPARAKEFLRVSPDYTLPLGVPYLGMGSSYFAPLAFRYMGLEIEPEYASEYYYYLSKRGKSGNAVILSQSGESSESLWCADFFSRFTPITNNGKSSLTRHSNAGSAILLHAGEEKYSSSKTYINALLALFKGFGFDASSAVSLLNEKYDEYRKQGQKMAGEIYSKITTERIHGIYITGSGPNVATAYEASLIMSETTKMCFTGLPMAQYDHGPKETAAGSIVIQILSGGKTLDRALRLADRISEAGAHVFSVGEQEAGENFSVIHNMIPFNYMAAYLATLLGIGETFAVGGKVTTVE
jgi:glucosamine--fructose-6-phosphate aminotransferase (isomerizing)